MSIRVRLTLYWAAVLAGVLVIAGVAVFLLFERQQWGELDGALLEEADTASETIARLGANSAGQIAARLSQERDLGPSRRVLLIHNGRILAAYGNAAADLPEFSGELQTHALVEGRAHAFRYAIVGFPLANGRVYLADGVDATPVRASIARLRASLLLIVPLLLVLGVSGGYWLAGRALVPINSLSDELARIEPRDSGRRVPLPQVRDEVARLTRAINGLLDRVERASTAERRFAADAAHELRTPLAVLRTGLEVVLGHERGAGEYAEAIGSALREVVALCRIADELLAIARLDQEAALERKTIDLGALATEVSEAVEPVAQARNQILRVDMSGPVMVRGNPNHLRRLIINLLDNALKFTPEHGRIELAVEAHNGSAKVRVADSGQGIPASDLPLVFERFFRGKHRGESGSGLGLSLCREIVLLHGGEITVANRPEGGAEFVVTLPSAAG
ncbi:MAG TPA: HAMP domain-containing sensor histidine kinase [Candidatus Binataceae bacterium]|nr:HAMP domain-containing sensor histidine kinase [Candidatus Binataceae bacterium]